MFHLLVEAALCKWRDWPSTPPFLVDSSCHQNQSKKIVKKLHRNPIRLQSKEGTILAKREQKKLRRKQSANDE